MPDRDAPRRRTSPRGEHRRGLLVEAAGALLAEEGFAAVSHRSVAQRAGLPLAATTYYFATLDELLERAVDALAENWLRSAREVVAGLPERLPGPVEVAEAVLRLVTLAPGGEPAGVLPLYERYLEAARHPHLRARVVQYDEQLETLVGEVLRRGRLPDTAPDARLVLAVADGALLRALAEGASPASAATPVERLLRGAARR